MRCPRISELPAAPQGRRGWPWTEETLPPADGNVAQWPRITVVTPSFNQGLYLEETIRSVLLQGYPDLEYVIIDGGSTDESVEIIKAYEPFLARWVSEKDNGQAGAINKGFSRSRGDVLGWVNSDDLYRQGALAHVGATFARMQEVDFLYGDCYSVDSSGRVRGQRWPPKDFSLEGQSLDGCMIAQPSCFWRRRAFEKLGPLREDLHVMLDYEYWRRAALGGFRFARTDEVLAYFRDHEAQKTSTLYPRWLHEERQLFSEERQDPQFPLGPSYFRRKAAGLLRFEAEIRETEGDDLGSAATCVRALATVGPSMRPSDVLTTMKWLTKLLLKQAGYRIRK